MRRRASLEPAQAVHVAILEDLHRITLVRREEREAPRVGLGRHHVRKTGLVGRDHDVALGGKLQDGAVPERAERRGPLGLLEGHRDVARAKEAADEVLSACKVANLDLRGPRLEGSDGNAQAASCAREAADVREEAPRDGRDARGVGADHAPEPAAVPCRPGDHVRDHGQDVAIRGHGGRHEGPTRGAVEAQPWCNRRVVGAALEAGRHAAEVEHEVGARPEGDGDAIGRRFREIRGRRQCVLYCLCGVRGIVQELP
mmetsp:Transcript_120566/g.336394  ORF Transcript_120566/g.336394 Transcript_120566/m.336394 type:complete len:257 (+) Transcript_120566:257-1027(+)